MSGFKNTKKRSPESESDWENRFWDAYNKGKGNWIFNNCPPPTDPEFKHHCPPQYLSLFGVT